MQPALAPAPLVLQVSAQVSKESLISSLARPTARVEKWLIRLSGPPSLPRARYVIKPKSWCPYLLDHSSVIHERGISVPRLFGCPADISFFSPSLQLYVSSCWPEYKPLVPPIHSSSSTSSSSSSEHMRWKECALIVPRITHTTLILLLLVVVG